MTRFPVPRRIRSEAGFTLIELVVAMPVALLVLGGVVLSMTTLFHWSGQATQQATNQIEARAALNTIADSVRGAFIGDGTPPVVAATATSMTLYSPDRTPTITAGSTMSSFHLDETTYSVTSGQLQSQSMTSTNTFPAAPPWAWPAAMSAWSPMLSSITNTTVFAYYTAAGLQASPPTPLSFPIADTSGIRAVGITLTVSAAANGIAGAKPLTVSDTIAIRGTG